MTSESQSSQPTPDSPNVRPGLFGRGLWLLVTITALALVTFVGAFTLVRTELAIRAENYDLLIHTLDDTVQQLHAWRDERLDDISVAMAVPEVQAGIEEMLADLKSGTPPSASVAQEQLRARLKPVMASHAFLGFFLITPDGVNVASSRDANLGQRNILLNQNGFFDKILAGEEGVSLPQRSDVPLPWRDGVMRDGAPTMFVAAPVYSRRDPTKVVAVFAFRLNVLSGFSAILERGRSRSSIETYAFDRHGVLLNESRFVEKLQNIHLVGAGGISSLSVDIRDPGVNLTQGFASHIPRQDQPLTLMAASAIKGEAGENLDGYNDYRGVPVIGVWRWDDKMGYGITTEMDASEAYDVLGKIRYMVIGLTALSVLLILGLSVYFQRSRRALQEGSQRTQAILDNVADGLIVISPKGIVETINPAAEIIFGYSSHEVEGRNIKMLMPEPYHSEHDGYLHNYHTTGVPKIIGNDREVQGRRKSGDVFPMDLHVSEVVLDGQQKFLGAVRDITERHAAEEDLRHSEANLKLAQRIAHLGSWSWDIPTSILHWTDEIFKIFGHPPGSFDPTYEAFMNAIHPDDREKVQQAVNESLETKKPYSVEHRVVQPDGRLLTVHEQGEVTVSGSGEAVRMDGTVHDITERKEAERMKSQFVSSVSHELRTPLTAIHGSLGLLSGGAVGELDDKVRSLLDVAYSNSERLIRLINDILDSEKISAGKMHFNLKSHDLDEMLDHAIRVNAPYADKLGVRLVCKGASTSAQVMADADRFGQVMANLISNAAKFSPEGERVVVSADVGADRARISVQDFGPGVPEDFRAHIFQHFTQADQSDTRAKGGTGLGLNITRAIVEQMGGHIGFESEVGAGATFFFDLPLDDGGEDEDKGEG